MRKICVVTGTRADYGIMSGLMRLVEDDPGLQLQTVATNMHLSPEFGMTVGEIEADGFRVDRKVEMLLSSDTAVGTVKSMGLAMVGFADAFEQLSPDIIVILGDRYEMLAAASAALVFGIPVAHLHGGEITEGAYDDAIRHAITKLSRYHFTSTEEYRRRVIQMGEEPSRVFHTGSPAVDAISRFEPMSREALEDSLGMRLADDFLLVTFHPVTMQPGEAERQTDALLRALDETVMKNADYTKVKVLFTMPNSDTDGRAVAGRILRWADLHAGRALAVTSLGRDRYYSAMAHCAAVVGNSSSGLIEAPSFGVPTLDIGDRQKGRTSGNTVTHCAASREAIASGLREVLSKETRENCRKSGTNPYHLPGTAERIHRFLATLPAGRHEAKKFYDARLAE